jgi:hypothetical protein
VIGVIRKWPDLTIFGALILASCRRTNQAARMHARGARLAVLGALGAWCTIIACSSPDAASDAGAPSCPNDLPTSCPDPPPSYASDIAPLLEQRCFPCHDSDGAAGPLLEYTSYDSVYQNRQAILSQVYGCRMPPPDAGQPTPSEREQLLDWLVCHAPDN